MATIKKTIMTETEKLPEKKVFFDHCSQNQIKCFIDFNGKRFLAAEIKKNFDKYVVEYMSSKLSSDIRSEIEAEFEKISKL